jgi:hypothetical protein
MLPLLLLPLLLLRTAAAAGRSIKGSYDARVAITQSG